jgi:ABC-type multidrug transport system ATPase subunit
MSAPAWRRQVIYVAAESGWWAEDVGAHFADPDAAAEIIEDLGLPRDALGWPVGRLSTGEQQRLALARAMALRPPVLLLDEPTSGLDPESTSRAERLLSRTLTEGVAILLVTHDGEQAIRMANRHFTMAGGRLTADDQAAAGAAP